MVVVGNTVAASTVERRTLLNRAWVEKDMLLDTHKCSNSRLVDRNSYKHTNFECHHFANVNCNLDSHYIRVHHRHLQPDHNRDFFANHHCNNIGNHVTASPFVRPGDFTVPGDRPETAGSQPSVRSVRLFCRNFALILP